MFISLILLFSSIQAKAFDPFTILSAGSSTVSAVAGAAGAGGSSPTAAVTGNALADLLDEVGVYKPAFGPDELVDHLNDITMRANELGYDREEIDSLVGKDRDHASSLAESIHNVQRAVKVGKSIAHVFKLDAKTASQASSVASLTTAQSSLQVEQDILAELQKQRIDEKTANLKEEIDREKVIKKGRSMIEKQGSKVLSSGVVTFPIEDDRFILTAIEVSKTVTKLLMGMLTLVFLIRVSASSLHLNSPDRLGGLMEDTFLCLIMLVSYPLLIQALMICARELNNNINFRDMVNEHLPHASIPLIDSYWRSLSSKILLLEYTVFFPIIGFIFKTIIAVLITIGPLVIFLSCMFGFSMGVVGFFGILAAFAVWPLVWNAFYAFGAVVFIEGDKSGETISKLGGFLVWLLQIVSPFTLAHFFGGQHVASLAKGIITEPIRLGTGLALGQARGTIGTGIAGTGRVANGFAKSFKRLTRVPLVKEQKIATPSEQPIWPSYDLLRLRDEA